MRPAARMGGGTGPAAASITETYLARSGMFTPGVGDPQRYDEMTGPEHAAGAVLPGWAELAATLDAIGEPGLHRLAGRVDRLLEDDGVTYTPVDAIGADPAAPPADPERWRLDPLPLVVDEPDWNRLEAGLVQRSLLLDAVLSDLYSDQRLVENRLLPPELIYRHGGYLRPAHGISIPGAHQLFFHAVDVCRSATGGFVALGDRTQAPSGAGYAMADRRVVSRVLPDLFRTIAPRGLGVFFHTVRSALASVAPNEAEDPRVVVLSPGTHSETAFDQAMLASLLGVPLVESADLTIRRGRLWMLSMGRFEPVDVVVRRVDDLWSDPLDLRPDSRLGVVGLTEACRRGAVTVVNSAGSGLLESPGLLPFLPGLARAILGETLKLESVPTFWCGADAERGHVLAHLDQMVLRPTGRGRSVFPALMSSREQQRWRDRVQAEPASWVGQQVAPFSEAPMATPRGLAAGQVSMRLFTVSHGSGYVPMHGALGRVQEELLAGSDHRTQELLAGSDHRTQELLAGSDHRTQELLAGSDHRTQELLAGSDHRTQELPAGTDPVRSGRLRTGIAKDVWVRSGRTAAAEGRDDRIWLYEGPLVHPERPESTSSPRVLEDLYWLGRYAERTEDLTRLLIATRERIDDFRFRPEHLGAGCVPVLTAAVSAVSATRGFVPGADPLLRVRELMLEATEDGTVAQSLAGLRESARAVRDQLSGDTWMVLASTDRAMAELTAVPGDGGIVLSATQHTVLSSMLAISGLAGENMIRDPGWYFMDLGRRLERAQQLTALLRATLTVSHSSAVDSLVVESVVAASESGVTYRRRYRGRTQIATMLELLLLDAGNPRSLAYQVAQARADLRALPDASATSRPQRRLEDVDAVLRRCRPEDLGAATARGERPELRTLLEGLHDSLRGIADAIAAQHFWHPSGMQPLGVVAVEGGP